MLVGKWEKGVLIASLKNVKGSQMVQTSLGGTPENAIGPLCSPTTKILSNSAMRCSASPLTARRREQVTSTYSPCRPTPPSPLLGWLMLRLVTSTLCRAHPALPEALAPAELQRRVPANPPHPPPRVHTPLVFLSVKCKCSSLPTSSWGTEGTLVSHFPHPSR